MTNKVTSKTPNKQQEYYIKQEEVKKQYCYKPYRTLQNY